ncbi:MAG: fibronectin type III domain-containing protein [Elusimicrobia bacterium]|nr:fibronectin type III domain-containing protein [Elusimicrobiota bacterium]
MLTGLLFRLLLAGLPAAPSLAAGGPTIYSPQVQQCDGNFQTGTTTRKITPRIRVPIRSTVGLRVGRQPTSYNSSNSLGLWRFNGSYPRSQENDCSVVPDVVNEWDDAGAADAPWAVGAGASLVYPGSGDFIYAFRGNGVTSFARYSISGNSWDDAGVADAPWGVGAGGALVYPNSGDKIYALSGNNSVSFATYSISGNVWGSAADAPWTVGTGGSLVYPGSGDFIYAFRGNGVASFARYSISGNSWSDAAATDPPAWTVTNVSGLVYPGSGNFIYALEGAVGNTFSRYSISGNSWDDAGVADAPWTLSWGGSIVYPGSGDYIFALRGTNTQSFARYSISGNSWDDNTVTDAPWTVETGGALVYPGSGKYIYAFRGNAVSSFARYSSSAKRMSSWRYLYTDPEGLVTATMGRCTYTAYSASTVTAGCPANLAPMDLDAAIPAAPLIAPIPLASCPTSTQSLADQPTPVNFPAGLHSEAVSLDGAHSVVLETTSTLVIPVTYSLSAWVRTSAGGSQRILSHQDGSKYWGFGLNGGALRRFDSRESAGNQDISIGSGLNDNAWHHVTVVRWNNSSWRYFIDGLFVGGTAANNAGIFSSAFTAMAYIGSYIAGSEFFNGTIDDLRLWEVALLDDEVAAEYNSTLHRYSTDGSTYTYLFRNPTGANNDAFNPPASDDTTSLVFYEPQTINYSDAPNHRFVFIAENNGGYLTSSYPFNLTVDRSPPSKPALSGNPQSTSSIEWSWSVPDSFCVPPESASSYTLVNRTTGAEIISVFHPTLSITESFGGEPPNQIHGRGLYAKDLHGASPISDGATAYTHAAAPAFVTTAFDANSISTGSVLLRWLASNNPTYTRYEVEQTLTPGFGGSVATLASISDNLTADRLGVSGLSPGTTYYARVRAKNGRHTDSYGSQLTSYGTTDYTTLPAVPALMAAALSTGSVRWDWSSVTGAFGYKLYSSTNGLMIDTPTLFYSSGTLSTNTAYGASVEAYGRNPLLPGGRSPLVYVFTLATSPVGIAITEVSTNYVVMSWNPNGNPPGTYYEVVAATNSSFQKALSTTGVIGTSVLIDDLFPLTTYYFRMRTVSNGGLTTEFLPQTPLKAATYPNPFVSVSSGPVSPYVLQAGLVGLWHLDESAGTTASDASLTVNNGALTCLASACASTPTFTTGPSNMGNSVTFRGQADSLVRIPAHAAYNFAGDITVSAWVNPATLNQSNGAGIAAKGAGGSEDFSLDAAAGKYRFMFSANKTVSSTMTITAGAWTHLTGIYSSAAGGTLKILVNGVLSAATSGHGARPTTNTPVTIGSRQSGAGTFDLSFSGSVDEVRLYSYAMTDDQVLADYRAAFPTAYVPASNVTGVSLELPANAFTTGQPFIFISPDPVNQPVRPGTSLIEIGLTAMPTGQRFIEDSLVEIVPIIDGVPFTGLLGSQATVYISYPDTDGDGVLDGTNPPIHASTLRAFVFEPSVLRWEPLATTVDPANSRVAALTPHFSIFGLFGAQVYGNSLAEVRVYPVPWQIRSGGRFDAANLVFDRLPTDGLIRIYSLAGEKIVELGFGTSGQGRALWNGSNFAGQPAASGVYLAHIKSATDGATKILKFVVER